MHWQHATEFGQHVDRQLYCPYSLLIHVPRRSTFLQIHRAMAGGTEKPVAKRGERMTRDWYHLECFEDAGLDSPESSQQSGHTASTAKSNPSLTGGFIALKVPVHIYEKRRADLPTCFILGRGHIADLRLDGSASSALARHQLAIGLMRGYWAVQNLAKGYVTLEDDSLHHGQTVVLHPDRRNSFRVGRSADPIEFHVYCRHPAVVKDVSNSPQIFETSVMRPIESSEGTTITATDAGPPASDGAPRLHFLEHQPLPSRTAIPKFHALDAETADVYIAKEYPLPCEDMLAERYGLLEPLRSLSPSPFLPDRRVIEYEGKIYSLVLKQDGIVPLAALDGILESLVESEYLSVSRRLLWNLLRTIGKLHQLGIAHADICQHTVLMDQHVNMAQVFLGGFSEAVSLSVNRAREDCFQVFAEVRRFLGALAEKLPPSWLGNEVLVRIWNENALSSAATWPYTAESICHEARIDLEMSTEKWTSIRATKEVLIRHSIQDERAMVNFEDIREYMVLNAVCGSRLALELDPARDIVLSVLDRCRPADGAEFVSVESVLDLRGHLSRKHGRVFAAMDLFTSLEFLREGRRQSQLILLPVFFAIPYNIRYGLVSLTRLRSLAVPRFDPEQLRPLVHRCYEVRGSCDGIFVPYETFESAADMLDIKYNSGQLFERSDSSAAAFTHPSWFLLAANESSDLFPVSRSSSIVTMTSKQIALGEFLTRIGLPDSSVAIAYDAEALVSRHHDYGGGHSCQGDQCTSCNSSEETRGTFKFKRRRDLSPVGRRIEEWVERTVKRRR